MSGSQGWRVLVVAKAPVAGLAKTRLGAVVGDDAAAAVAGAALLDTLLAARATVGAERCVLALTGDLSQAAAGDEIVVALDGWTVVRQRGDSFDERLVAAHLDSGTTPVVQVGMDTPQLTPDLLRRVAAGLADHDAVVEPASDGGWWALGLRNPAHAVALRGVATSTATTGADTVAALRALGLRVEVGAELRDVDTVADADAVAGLAPGTHFARTWTSLKAQVA